MSCHVICCSCICPGCILSCPVSVPVTKRLQLLPLPLRPGPLSRNLITFDHNCSRLLSSVHSCLYPYVFRYKTFRGPVPVSGPVPVPVSGPVPVPGLVLSLVLVLVTAGCSWSDPGLVRCIATTTTTFGVLLYTKPIRLYFDNISVTKQNKTYD